MTARTYDYDARAFDPVAALQMSGLDYMRALMRGEVASAPIAATMNFTLVEVDDGRAVFEGTPQRYVYNPIGSVHGGWYATLLDSCMGCAAHTTLPAGKAYTTIDLAITIVRAASEATGPLRAIGSVIHRGSSILTGEGRIVGPDGKLYAHGTTTCLVLSPRG